MIQETTTQLDILRQSPHDLHRSEADHGQDVASGPEEGRWIPSRYNARATGEDGRLILWNSFRGSMSIFEAEQRPAVESLLSQRGFEGRTEGMVKYLLDRGFLLKEGTDEYRRFQLRFGRQQYRTDRLWLTLLASEDCNFRCRYCYEEFARGTMEPWVRAGIKKLVRKQVPGLRNLRVDWFGGEPLYGLEAIEDLAPFFLETAEKHSLRLSSSMVTNGYLLTPEVAEKLLAWRITRYQITVDGLPEQHDRNRPTRNGQGTFSKIFDNLKALSKRAEDYRVNIRINFDRNHYHLERLFDLLADELGNDSRFSLCFRAVGRWGGSGDEQLEVCGEAESRGIRQELANQAREKGLRLTEDLRGRNPGDLGPCQAARPFYFVIGVSGKVMKCTVKLDKDDLNVVGQVTERGDLTLDHHKIALWSEPAFERHEKCKKCIVLPLCQGIGCPLANINAGKPRCAAQRLNLTQELRAITRTLTDSESRRRVVIGTNSAQAAAEQPRNTLAV